MEADFTLCTRINFLCEGLDQVGESTYEYTTKAEKPVSAGDYVVSDYSVDNQYVCVHPFLSSKHIINLSSLWRYASI